MLILGIESSCDDTALALVEDGKKVRASLVSSQAKLHEKYGGIVPEVACRAHYEVLMPMLDDLLKQAKVTLAQVDAVAVTNRPGLVGSLYVGLSAAKALAWATVKPIVAVDHIEAHIYAAQMADEPPAYPYVSVVVSGGHTDIFLTEGPTQHKPITRTLDDAAGECFDKVAALLGIGYPGGPAIQLTSLGGNREAINYPRGDGGPDGTQISFSGLKTAVLNDLKKRGFVIDAARNSGRALSARTPEPNTRSVTRTLSVRIPLADIAASFQEAAVDIVIRATLAATRKTRCKSVVLAGGVAANKRLREKLGEACEAQKKTKFTAAPLPLCTDNAVMVAGLGFHELLQGRRQGLDLDVMPNKDEKREKQKLKLSSKPLGS
ncbi:MAG: tRNA (adenosine(37)-N6)-threonylcarbamoyltransferase complex transferase subunit TsaD [Planctomycetaceae bacterium]|nr:tRNA (adenosine(37)-N6)-threonylcarbamoyltransferase complex transferase subunit TsaD [Planctomycetota bacterium]NUO15673.1 tRNA (adenosine(37)-N6)-threonylcarbamoyltransferase complex transferase subunit TsaD [Planctomycetaceae bacterium]GIK53278.1 MAG: tRNA (adenosine(37)-N6)-threonylcarbamoyltransferase complex transferase subunit TsaD [Planctomycetota bacterium]